MNSLILRHRPLLAGALLLAAGLAAAAGPGADAAATPAADPDAVPGPVKVEITAESFKCIRDMTPVRGFFVDNLLGNLDATLAVANSPTGGVYPPGSVVQLFPNEVMVKREQGFNPVTRDWEFFELDVSKEGTVIRKRGFADVNNRFGGNCFACHVQAKPEWDMICEKDHGCEKLPVSDFAVKSLQKADARCDNSESALRYRVTDWMIRVLSPL